MIISRVSIGAHDPAELLVGRFPLVAEISGYLASDPNPVDSIDD
jgi:hypothetical protein